MMSDEWRDITEEVSKEALDEFNNWWKKWKLEFQEENDVEKRREFLREEGKRWKKLGEAIGYDTVKYDYEIRFDRLVRRKR